MGVASNIYYILWENTRCVLTEASLCWTIVSHNRFIPVLCEISLIS